jgi:hypothetical protein
MYVGAMTDDNLKDTGKAASSWKKEMLSRIHDEAKNNKSLSNMLVH